MTITAKYAGKCSKCGGGFAAGAQIEWAKGAGASHASCSGTTRQPKQTGARGVCVKCGKACKAQYSTCWACSGKTQSQASLERTYRKRYGWDGVRGSASYYSSGMYDEES